MMRLEFRSERRGYTMTLSRDLFGAYVLWRRWYGLRNRRGGAKVQTYLSEAEAMAEVRRVARVRARHGYALIEG